MLERGENQLRAAKRARYTPPTLPVGTYPAGHERPAARPSRGAARPDRRRTDVPQSTRPCRDWTIRTLPVQEESTMQLSAKHQEYWSRNLRITAILLAIWFVVTFVIGFFARDLSFNFFGWPFAFYMGAQGSLIIYVVIIWYYARYMNTLDREYDVHEGDE
jgi:putative solute:sodium symporter small subunit